MHLKSLPAQQGRQRSGSRRERGNAVITLRTVIPVSWAPWGEDERKRMPRSCGIQWGNAPPQVPACTGAAAPDK